VTSNMLTLELAAGGAVTQKRLVRYAQVLSGALRGGPPAV